MGAIFRKGGSAELREAPVRKTRWGTGCHVPVVTYGIAGSAFLLAIRHVFSINIMGCCPI